MDADKIKKILIIMLIAIGVVGVILAIVAICTNVSCGDKEEEHVLAVSVVEPTCTEKGYTLHACICGYGYYKTDYVAALGHDFKSVAEKKATCDADGYNAHTSCTRCDAKVGYKKEEKLGHSWKDEEVILAATCTEDGTKKIKCERCGAEDEAAIPTEGHKWGEPTINAATCDADGEERKVCTACNEEEKTTLPALGHDLYNQTNGPTCTENIKHFELCHRCDYSRLLKEEADTKSSHLVKAEGIPCDDPENGYACENPDKKHYRECSVCGIKIIEDHTASYIQDSDTLHRVYCEICKKSSYDSHVAVWDIKPSYHKKYCSKCNYAIQAQTSHNLVEDECSVCNYNSWTQGLSYAYNESNQTCTVSGMGSVKATVIKIPKQIDKDGVKYTVTAIGANAFSGKNITEVTVYSTIEKIGANAFNGCLNLKTVNIHNENLKEIDSNAFGGDNIISKVVIADPVKWSQTEFVSLKSTPTWKGSGVYNFSNTANYISNLDLSEDSQGNDAEIESVKNYAFYGWKGITGITLPITLKTIGEYAFAYNDVLQLNLNNIPIETISAHAFDNCMNMNTISLGGSIKTIASNAFYNCNRLRIVGIDNSSLESIGASAFSGCNGVSELNISDLGKWSKINFANGESNPANHGVSDVYLVVSDSTNKITHLDFSSEVTPGVSEIGQFAFYGWKGISEVTIPSTVTKIGESAFGNCFVDYEGKLCINDLESWSQIAFANGYSNPGWRGWNVFLGDSSSPLTEIDLSASSITNINACAFYGWKYITSIKLPTNLESVGAAAFHGCGITKLELSMANISAGLFSGCEALKTLTINGTVQSIGKSAFSDCIQLETITIDNTSLTEIGADAFKGCENVKKVSVKDYDRWVSTFLGNENSNPAHNGCDITETKKARSLPTFGTAISEIDLSASTFTEIKPYVFYGWKSIDSFKFPTTLKTVGKSAFYGCSGITELVLSAETISANAFVGCTNLERLTLNNAKEIGERAFEGCGITELSLSAETISEYAFSNCLSLQKLTLTSSVKNIGAHAFEGCGITELVSSAQTVSANAFEGCSSLETLTLNGNVQSIGVSAFGGCTNLATVTIDNSTLAQIETNAFNGCNKVTKFSLKDLTKWSQVNFGNANSNPAHCGSQIYLIDENPSAALTQIDLSQSKNITKINAYAFYGLKNITVVKIPDTLNLIGESAFAGCDNVTELHVDNIDQWLNKIELKDSGSSPLNNRAGSIYVGGSLFDTLDLGSAPITNFTTQALHGLKGLTTVILPTSVETIGAFVFEGCSDLTTITYIGSSLKKIDCDAFLNCTKITDVRISDVKAWCKINFVNAVSNPLAVTKAAASLKIYNGSGWSSNLGDVILDESITKINPYTFKNATINSLKVSEKLTSIGEYAFQGSNMKELTLDLLNLKIGAHAFDSSKLEKVTLSVNSIGEKAFAACTNLKQVTINSCINFGASVFSGCGGMTALTLPFVGNTPENVSANEKTLFGYLFGKDAFVGATSTYQRYSNGSGVAYYIPDSLQNVTVLGGKIRYGAFYNCNDIAMLTIGENVIQIDNYAFAYCNGLTTLNYYSKICANLSNGNNVFLTNHIYYNYEPKMTVNIGVKVEIIPNYLFHSAHEAGSDTDSYVKELKFLTDNGASECTKIGDYAFDNLFNITALHLPNSINKIGEGAFRNCSALTKVNIVDSVKTIGKGAFQNCTSLSTLTIGKSVETIEDSAFNGCAALTEINFNAIKCSDFNDPKNNNSVFYDSLMDSKFTGVALNIGEDVTRVPSNILKKSKVKYILLESKADKLQIGEGTIGSAIHDEAGHLFTIYFKETDKVWKTKIKLAGSSGSWILKNVCYYSEQQPTGTPSGRGFWHYDDNHRPVYWS